MDDQMPSPAPLEVGRYRLGGDGELFLILGPCVIESEQLTLDIARELARISQSTSIPVIFKASFDKANRTSVESFRGPGLEKGLEVLKAVRQETGLPVISDIHTPDQAEPAGRVLDVIQIPAFLSRQTDLLLAAAKTGKTVNIKKGQFQAPPDMVHALKKVLSTGNDRIMITERGATFGYNDLVADMRSIVRMKRFGFPVVFDATHSAQFPGRGDGRSGGDRSLVPWLARSAVAAGADGIFMEVHPEPDKALCDGPNCLDLGDVEALAVNLQEIYRLIPRREVGLTDQRAFVRSEPTDDLPTLEDRLKKIRLLIFDVDGVLTDGRITFGSGDLEIKSFDVRDGHGIKIAKRCGLEVAMVTGRVSEVVPRRAQDLGVELVFQHVFDKRPVLAELLEKLNLVPEQVAIIGDDVVDIPLLRRAGAGFAVPDAPEEVRREAHYVTRRRGGEGAAREMIEMILQAQGKWDAALARYYE
ncbi:MAG: 3-deoxy-8-phosphooctulonate synthase [Desulfomonile tiedjei]|nr:3-deoxy-8-phosphooctulonate synthase [Desulfomonile tiedjei]